MVSGLRKSAHRKNVLQEHGDEERPATVVPEVDDMLTGEAFVEEFDANHDGFVSKQEYVAGRMRVDQMFDGKREVNTKQLLKKIMFEVEKASACSAACWFIFFTLIYIYVLDLQVETCCAIAN